MYIDNMDYFLEHGVLCGYNDAGSAADGEEEVAIKHVFVVTKQVADYYLSPEGLITQKRKECAQSHSDSSEDYIKVIVRQDRCYDMESMRVVLEDEETDVANAYDNLLFVNCGLVGPKCELIMHLFHCDNYEISLSSQ